MAWLDKNKQNEVYHNMAGLINITNVAPAITPAPNDTDAEFPYVLLAIAGLYLLLFGVWKGYEAIRDGRCNPCGLFRATPPQSERTYRTFDGGDIATFV